MANRGASAVALATFALSLATGCQSGNTEPSWPDDLPYNPEDGGHIDPISTELDVFYEGWYYKVVDPASGEGFFFIYTVTQDHAFLYCGRQSTLQTVFEVFPKNAYSAATDHRDVRIGESARATAVRFAGRALEDGLACSWDVRLKDGVAWNETMGWMTGDPNRDTNWTVGTIRASASGWVEFDGRTIRFDDAIGYCDHNWGKAFPRSWVWLQAASFPGTDAAIAASGGLARYAGRDIRAMMIGLYLDGGFVTFRTQDLDKIDWTADKGTWSITAERRLERLSIEASCDPGAMFHLLVPTESGMEPHAWEALDGTVEVRLERRTSEDDEWQVAFEASSDRAGVEIGE